jgi:hypothetical protein
MNTNKNKITDTDTQTQAAANSGSLKAKTIKLGIDVHLDRYVVVRFELLHANHGTHGAKKNKRWNSVSASAVAGAMARQDER